MNILVGLGNPGQKYVGTRHNLGFEVLDILVAQLGIQFSSSKKTLSEIAKFGSSALLCKPHTFMNNSGQAVRALMEYYHLPIEAENPNVFVVHDDLDLPLGSIKLQYGTGPKGHNGLLSLYEHLGSKMFWHLRLGVDNRGEQRNAIVPSEYVLQNFLSDEQSTVDQEISEAVALLKEKLFP